MFGLTQRAEHSNMEGCRTLVSTDWGMSISGLVQGSSGRVFQPPITPHCPRALVVAWVSVVCPLCRLRASSPLCIKSRSLASDGEIQ